MSEYSNARRAAARCALAVATASGLAAVAHAEDTSARKYPVPPELHDQMVHAQQLRAAARAQASDQTLDTTPPTFTSVEIGTNVVNARNPTSGMSVKLHLTDDLSGVQGYGVEAISPSGQQYVFYGSGSAYPSNDFSSTAQLHVSPFAEPGTWQIVYAYAYDYAGNWVSLDQTELAAFGNMSFTVANSTPDLAPPRLAQGRILTPTVSISASPPGVPEGTYTAFAGAVVQVADSGTAATSGISSAQLTFCLPARGGGCRDLLYLTGYTVGNVTGPVAAALTLGTYTYPGQASPPTGTYQLYDAYVYDTAGNQWYGLSTAFGGTVDFSTLFPSTTIRVTP